MQAIAQYCCSNSLLAKCFVSKSSLLIIFRLHPVLWQKFMTISIVIPVFNEEDKIYPLIKYLQGNHGPGVGIEIIVSDAASTDDTRQQALKAGVQVVACPHKGRAVQMNAGAAHATGQVLYFLHADTYPPKNYGSTIARYIQNGCNAGAFKLKFNSRHWLLIYTGWLSYIPWQVIRFGDQSFFIERPFFDQLKGYNESMLLFEDQDLVRRASKAGKFCVTRQPVVTSARKFYQNGVVRLFCIFVYLYMLYRLGATQNRMVGLYRRLIRQGKI